MKRLVDLNIFYLVSMERFQNFCIGLPYDLFLVCVSLTSYPGSKNWQQNLRKRWKTVPTN